MALCYYKETFTLGFVSAFFVFAIVTLIEDAIRDLVGKFKRFVLERRKYKYK